MKNHVIDALIFFPFYLLYTLFGVNGYLSREEKHSPGSFYQALFGFCLLQTTFLVVMIRVIVEPLEEKSKSFDSFKTIVAINILTLSPGFFISALHYDNLNDDIQGIGILMTYAMVSMCIGCLSYYFWNLNRIINPGIGLILFLGVISIPCLIFDYQSIATLGYKLMIILSYFLIGYLLISNINQDSSQV
jgi:hypothetical protein